MYVYIVCSTYLFSHLKSCLSIIIIRTKVNTTRQFLIGQLKYFQTRYWSTTTRVVSVKDDYNQAERKPLSFLINISTNFRPKVIILIIPVLL